MLRLIVSLFVVAVAISAQVTLPGATGDSKPRTQKLNATLAGRVVSSTTGVPLAKAMVTLEAGKDKQYRVLSGKDGTFLFEDVEPGDYSMSVKRVGFLDGDGPELSLEPGERMKDVELKIAPQGVISGRVVDEDGDPVPSAHVLCYRWLGAGAKKHVVDSTSKQVDDEANFTFTGLKPGNYYLRAVDLFAQSGMRPNGNEALVATYYLSAAEVSGATPLHLSAGTELRNVEIRLRKVRVVRIRGSLANPGAGQPSEVYLKRKNSNEFFVESQSTNVRDGVFEFAAVEPGSYFVETSPNLVRWDRKTGETQTSTATLFGRQAVEVSGRNIDDLVLTLQPAIEVTGKIRMDRLKPSKDLRVKLSSSTYLRRPPEAEPAEDGSFTIGPLPPVEFKINVIGLPEGAYVKSMRHAGQEIGEALDLSTPGAGALEIVLSPNAATITGIVRDQKGEPVPYATIFAWKSDEPPHASTAASDGSFEIKNLPPGDFRVACWEEVVSTEASWLTLFEKHTRKVTLKEESRERVEVTLITKEVIEATEAK